MLCICSIGSFNNNSTDFVNDFSYLYNTADDYACSGRETRQSFFFSLAESEFRLSDRAGEMKSSSFQLSLNSADSLDYQIV